MVVSILVSTETPLTLKSPARSWCCAALLAVPSGCSGSANVRASAVLLVCRQPSVFSGWSCLLFELAILQQLSCGKWAGRSWVCRYLQGNAKPHPKWLASRFVTITVALSQSMGRVPRDSLSGICGVCNRALSCISGNAVTAFNV